MGVYRLKNEWIIRRPEERLYHQTFPIIGITGGISSGKSSALGHLKEFKLNCLSADQIIKKIYEQAETLEFFKKNHPQFLQINNQINFRFLREAFFQDHELKQQLENYLYPKMEKFFKESVQLMDSNAPLFYEVPLLYERKLELAFDLVICVYVPEDVQVKRLVLRDGISESFAKQILKKQISMHEKTQLANITWDNSKSTEYLQNQIKQFVRDFLEQVES